LRKITCEDTASRESSPLGHLNTPPLSNKACVESLPLRNIRNLVWGDKDIDKDKDKYIDKDKDKDKIKIKI